MNKLLKVLVLGSLLSSTAMAMNYEQDIDYAEDGDIHDSYYMEGKLQAASIDILQSDLEDSRRKFSKRISQLPHVLDIRFHVTMIDAIQTELDLIEATLDDEFNGPEAFHVGFEQIQKDIDRVNRLIEALR